MNRQTIAGYMALAICLVALSSSNARAASTGITGISGFRASDWNNSGTAIYAAKTDTIYRSLDRGSTWEAWYIFPSDPDMMSTYGEAWSLSIPTRLPGETTEMMLYSRYSDNSLWRCSDINASSPTFTKVLTSSHRTSDGKYDWGTMCDVAEDPSGNLYLAGYAWEEPAPAARLYKSSDRGASWQEISLWNSRHLHYVGVNSHNGWIYVSTSEHLVQDPPFTDSSKIFRSKDGGSTWENVWSDFDVNNPNTLVPMAITFHGDNVIFGTECQGYAQSATGAGGIYRFVDDGSSGPFLATKVYPGVGGDGEIWWGAAEMNGTLYYASTGQYKTMAPELVSSADGVTWIPIDARSNVDTSIFVDSNLAVITQHPNRAGRLIYSLSGNYGAYVDVGDVSWNKVDDNCIGCISYSGSAWTFQPDIGYQNTEHYSNIAGATATYTFIGTQARFYGYENSGLGLAEVYVDGALKSTIDTYSSTLRGNQLLYESSPLGSGSHTIKVEVTGTKNASSSGVYVSIDAFESAPVPWSMTSAINWYASATYVQ